MFAIRRAQVIFRRVTGIVEQETEIAGAVCRKDRLAGTVEKGDDLFKGDELVHGAPDEPTVTFLDIHLAAEPDRWELELDGITGYDDFSC